MDVSGSCNLNTRCRRKSKETWGEEWRTLQKHIYLTTKRKTAVLWKQWALSKQRPVNSHCRAEHLSVETSVRALTVNSGVMHIGVTCMQLRGSAGLPLSSLHSDPPHTSPSLSAGCLLYRVCQHWREILELFCFFLIGWSWSGLYFNSSTWWALVEKVKSSAIWVVCSMNSFSQDYLTSLTDMPDSLMSILIHFIQVYKYMVWIIEEVFKLLFFSSSF